jgi:hypothetical protein
MDSYQINLCQLAQRNFVKRKKKLFEAKWEWRKERDSEMSEKMYRTEKEKD